MPCVVRADITEEFPFVVAKLSRTKPALNTKVVSFMTKRTRKIVEVIFAYINRNTDVTEKLLVRVNVAGQFLFLVTKMSPYYDR